MIVKRMLFTGFGRRLFLTALKTYVSSTDTLIDDNVYKIVRKLLARNDDIEAELRVLLNLVKDGELGN